jgi:hypothetical protein
MQERGVPILLSLLLTAFYAIQSSDGFLAYLLLCGADAVLLAIWGGDTLILLWKHREAL